MGQGTTVDVNRNFGTLVAILCVKKGDFHASYVKPNK